jgi:phenylalanyl-tRNA synthetase beta chain
MKVLFSWLKDYCEFDLTAEEVAELFTMLGFGCEAIEKRGEDFALELEITPNRGDALSHMGLAREIAAVTGAPLKMPEIKLPEAGKPAAEWTDVEIIERDLCPRYIARIICDVKVKDSPSWLKERLSALGLRPVNNIVDITNFVMLECGQPLHAFDYDKLKEGKIVVRRARAEERIIAIDGTEQSLTSEMLAICDAQKPVAVAGCMGGLESEVTLQTKTVLLESAYFAPASIRRTSRALALTSDSSYRFERGVDPRGTDWASRRAAMLSAQIASGKVAPGLIDENYLDLGPKTAPLRPARLNKLLGLEIPEDEVKGILKRLGFAITKATSKRLTLQIPTFRPDIEREIDLIEEVARIHGFDKISDTSRLAQAVSKKRPLTEVTEKARAVLLGAGFYEVMTISFESPETLTPFGAQREAPVISNPIDKQRPLLRTTLLPGLLRVKKTNEDQGQADLSIFELAHTYRSQGTKDKLPIEKMHLALLQEGDFFAAKGVLESIFEALGLSGIAKIAPAKIPFLSSTHSAKICLGDEPIGVIGIISESLRDLFDLGSSPAVAELDFATLVEAAHLEKHYQPLPRFPATRRDLALVVDEEVSWASLKATIEEVQAVYLEEITFFDEYPLGEDKKSIALSLLFRSPEKTLIGEEVDREEERIVKHLQAKGFPLRGQ